MDGTTGVTGPGWVDESRSLRGRLALWFLPVLAGLAGCASQGPPKPPSLHLPAAVEHLSAERFGDTVDLHWTTPVKTTDGVFLVRKKHSDGPFTAEICRGATGTGPACVPFARVPVESGKPAEFHDRLPADWLQGPVRALQYRVRVVNGNGKGAGFTAVTIAGGEGPAPVEALRAARVASGGVLLQWKPGLTGDRTLLRVQRGPDAPSFSQGSSPSSQHAPGSSKSTENLLAVEAQPKDVGGAIDRDAKPGVEQRYTVCREKTVPVDGKNLTVHGEVSTVTVPANAQPAPPAPPTGLEAVVNTLGAPEIDLVWEPSPDADAVAYRVFRAEGSGPLQAVAESVRGFSFADTAVRAGVAYRYAVAAVDAQGAVGPMSAEARGSIPTQ